MSRFWFAFLLAFVLGATAVAAAGYDDFALGVSAFNRGDAEQAMADFTAALNAGDLNPALLPIAYVDRARVYYAKGECSLAAADLAAAMKAKPDYVDAYLVRAQTDECLNQDQAAIADFTQAIALAPTAVNYAGRGRTRWDVGDFAGAADDYAQAVKLSPKAPYYLLWLELCRMRAGTYAQGKAVQEVDALDFDDWPETILDFYAGKGTPEAVLQAAASDPDKLVYRQCEANFYVAEWRLSQLNSEAARPLLEDAVAHCAHNMREYSAARRELRRLK